MQDFVSKVWSRMVGVVTSILGGGAPAPTIWQVIDGVEAEPVPVPVPVRQPSSVPVTPRPPTWVR